MPSGQSHQARGVNPRKEEILSFSRSEIKITKTAKTPSPTEPTKLKIFTRLVKPSQNRKTGGKKASSQEKVSGIR